jgi:DNA-binding response OmpR family regulator
VEIEPDLPHLWVDSVRIRQVLFNLLSNASRFTEKGQITVKVCRERDDLVFTVADTGVGIAPEHLAHIFEEFRQVDGSTKRRHGGVGLGLSIGRRLVELHGGRIWVESQVGRGSTFYFSLPIGRPGGSAGQTSPVGSRVLPGRGSEGPVLLVITPNTAAAALLARYMPGYRALVAHDLEQARETAAALLPQGVVVDTAHFELSNEALRRVAEEWKLPQALFLGCPLPGQDLNRQLSAVDGYLTKPVTGKAILDELHRFGGNIGRVLIVDDDADFVQLVSRVLQRSPGGPEIDSAYSGQEGLLAMRRHVPDLLLLDLVLPDMDGADLIQRIRANPAWHHLPIVVISAQEQTESADLPSGPIVMTIGRGFTAREVLRWVQHALDLIVPSAAQAPGALP